MSELPPKDGAAAIGEKPESGKPVPSGKTSGGSAAPEKIKKPGLSRGEKALIGLVLAVILFAAGGLTVYFQFYRPLQARLTQAEQQLQAAQEDAQQLETRLSEVSGLETQNTELVTNLQKSDTLRTLLSARADVAIAMLALARDEKERARAALSQTDLTLQALAKLVQADQQSFVSNMQNRLKLAIDGLDGDAYAAQSDLDVLMNSLLELESVLNR